MTSGFCDAVHPEERATCFIRGTPEDHDTHFALDGSSWPNLEYVPHRVTVDPEMTQQVLHDLAIEVASRVNPNPHPVVAHDDPVNSHVAAERIEPSRRSKKAKVLAVLRAANGDWVEGTYLGSVDVGGTEGIRRVRELRDAGWDIEERAHPNAHTAWQYRLAGRVLRNFD